VAGLAGLLQALDDFDCLGLPACGGVRMTQVSERQRRDFG